MINLSKLSRTLPHRSRPFVVNQVSSLISLLTCHKFSQIIIQMWALSAWLWTTSSRGNAPSKNNLDCKMKRLTASAWEPTTRLSMTWRENCENHMMLWFTWKKSLTQMGVIVKIITLSCLRSWPTWRSHSQRNLSRKRETPRKAKK